MIGILADIHGNLEALEATLEVCRKRKVDEYVCLGDIVGYGASPNECVELVRETRAAGVLGNHDAAVFDAEERKYFNPTAKEAMDWTREAMSEENVEFLRAMPLQRSVDGALLVHSSPKSPAEWHYLDNDEKFAESFRELNAQLCFVGHTHMPVIAVSDPKGHGYTHGSNKLKAVQGFHYIVNAGSIGQPRDGVPHACFVLYEPETSEVEIVRAAYDVAGARKRMRDAGLPTFLEERLEQGI